MSKERKIVILGFVLGRIIKSRAFREGFLRRAKPEEVTYWKLLRH